MRHAVVLYVGDASTRPAPGRRTHQRRTHQAPTASAAQLPPEIMVDRHLVRVHRLLAADDPEPPSRR